MCVLLFLIRLLFLPLNFGLSSKLILGRSLMDKIKVLRHSPMVVLWNDSMRYIMLRLKQGVLIIFFGFVLLLPFSIQVIYGVCMIYLLCVLFFQMLELFEWMLIFSTINHSKNVWSRFDINLSQDLKIANS